MKRKIIALLTVLMLISNSAYASILGTDIQGWSHKIANGTILTKGEFMSTQSGVGKQTEYYATYFANSDIIPTVISGGAIWGRRTIEKAEEYMKANNMIPMLGINASYFSLQTGIPMGHVISNGKIVSKDLENYQSIGFNSDGTAFIAPLKISTFLKSNDTKIEISHINKYNQTLTPIVNLYTEDFDTNNHNDVPSLSLILGEINGELKINGTLSAIVEEKFNYQGPLEIMPGKMILTLNENSDEELYNSLNSIEVGDSVEICSVTETDDDRWQFADSGLGSVGETLILNGEIQSGFSAGATGRTAVGIKPNGDILFYVIDGKQKGYSYGVKLTTLAERMKELGCVDAINLDGGGSTSLSAIFPGMNASQIINSPSDGALRKCSNYIFLKNAKKPTGILGGLYIYPFEQHYLSGYSDSVYITAVDNSYYPMANPTNLEISISDGESAIDLATNVVTFNGTNDVIITAKSDDIIGSSIYHSYETPTDVVAKKEDGTIVEKLNLKDGDKVSLVFDAYYDNIKLKATQESFKMEFPSEFGKTNGNTLTINSKGGEANLKIIVGNYVKEIPVFVEYSYPFIDVIKHWARDNINYVYENGIISGYQGEKGQSFLPDNQITREEFSVIVSKFLKIDSQKYLDYNLEFYDKERISEWAKPYVSALVQKGIIYGKTSENKVFFEPKSKLTRAEAITILGRILYLDADVSSSFADDNDIPIWAKEEVYKMVSNGLISGYEDNTIRPNNLVSRAEAVTIIYNIMKKDF